MELSKEIYGPRNGCYEKITSNPMNEYLVGVIEPKESTRGNFTYLVVRILKKKNLQVLKKKRLKKRNRD
jgi:hypothetical protein